MVVNEKVADRTIFLSTPSARRATRSAPRVDALGRNFYPRPPRGGRRWIGKCHSSKKRFLSTPSARRATFQAGLFAPYHNISIHALREEGDDLHGVHEPDERISIHALREEGDIKRFMHRVRQQIFLSTPSARRATPKPSAI